MARSKGGIRNPKHGKNDTKYYPRSLAQLTDRSTNSIRDEVLATHRQSNGPDGTSGVAGIDTPNRNHKSHSVVDPPLGASSPVFLRQTPLPLPCGTEPCAAVSPNPVSEP